MTNNGRGEMVPNYMMKIFESHFIKAEKHLQIWTLANLKMKTMPEGYVYNFPKNHLFHFIFLV